jgi:dihydropteroate synthase
MQLACADRRLDLSTPVVMGILNVTPDSFSDGGLFLGTDAALAQAERMASEGAAIIDIGGESTRPRAASVSTEEELRRVIPVIERVAARVDTLISIDTSNGEVMRAAVAAGAHMINDVRALRSPGALAAAAASAAAVCLMHMQGEPATMQNDPRYGDVVAEVAEFLGARVRACEAAGIARARLCIDPGFGFGKRREHNIELLRHLGELRRLQLPLLVGLSRKSLLQELTGRRPAERLAGSLALATAAVLAGAQIVRAHDVAATVDAVRVAAALRAGGQCA